MTLPASTSKPIESGLPTASERDNANQLRKIFSAQRPDKDIEITARVSESESATIVLSPSMSKFLMSLLRFIGSGNSVTLVPISEDLSTKQAADLLNVSRPHLIKLLDEEKIPHYKVGRHRRISASDVFEYRDKMRNKKREGLKEMAEIDTNFI